MSDVSAIGSATGGTTAASTTKTTGDAKTSFKETLAKVSGHHYAKITNGDRKGMYVNQSGNARNGDAFKLVERDGHEFHVYGEGKDRKVFEIGGAGKKAAGSATASTDATAKS